MPTMRKPAFWIMARISPAWPAATASGLMMENVRSIAHSRLVLNLFADVGGRGADGDAGGLHGRDFVLGLAAAAGDDGAGVAHAAAGRRGLAGDEADDRLLHVLLDVGGGRLFGVAADFADHDDGVGVGVVVEELEGVDEGGADDGVAADADAGGLADAELGELADGFIGQRAGARDDADVALLDECGRA